MRNMVKNENVLLNPYSEPLWGGRIMGMTESRMLDMVNGISGDVLEAFKLSIM